MTEKRGDLKKKDDRTGTSVAEIVSVTVSVVVVLALFGYVTFKAVTAPDGPHFQVEQVKVEPMGDEVAVHVFLRNQGSVGVRVVDVEIPCDDPPPSVSFPHVPASGERRAVLICPADAEDLQPKVSGWIEA